MIVFVAHKGLVPFTCNVVPLAVGEPDVPLDCALLIGALDSSWVSARWPLRGSTVFQDRRWQSKRITVAAD